MPRPAAAASRLLALAAIASATLLMPPAADLLLPIARATQDSSALISEALDKPINLDLPGNTPLPQVIDAITRDTGVPLTVSPDVYELLPWGEQTGITAKIQNQTLREALAVITRRLGLTFELTDQSVELRPMPALRRLGRRATLPELEVLDLLARTPAGLKVERPTVNALLEAVDEKLETEKAPFAVENRAFDGKAGQAQVPVARNATMSDALESIHHATGATWYPWGKTLVIRPKEEQVRAQLQKTINTRYNKTDLGQVLTELSARAGVPFAIEPGAVQRVPPDYRNVTLILDNATIQQALESIAAVTGLAYTVDVDGVKLSLPQSAAAAGGPAREPIFGILPLDNGMQVLVPASKVPADLREYLDKQVERKFQTIREQMQEEGFKPSTQPAATQPAAPSAAATAPKSEDL